MNLKCWVVIVLALLPLSDAEARKARKGYLDLTIVVYGDTFSAGYELSRSDTYALELRKRINEEFDRDRIEVINASVEGDTASTAMARLPQILAYKPDLVILALGGTDAYQQVDPGITMRALNQILGVLTHNNIYVMLAGFQAPPDAPLEFASQFNLIFPTLINRYNVSYVTNLLDGVAGKWDRTLYDGVYPDEAGMQQMADNLYPTLEDMYIKLRSQRQ